MIKSIKDNNLGDLTAMNQLEDIFYNPEGFGVLPYRHNYTEDGEYVLTGFFIPAYCFLLREDCVDKRGVTNTKKAKAFYQKNRDALIGMPDDYTRECAEYCFTPQEAFLTRGDNIFDTALLAMQATAIKLKQGPAIQDGELEYKFKDGKVSEDNIERVIFKPVMGGKVHILELPKTDEDDKVPPNLYVAGIDGIDLGQEDTSEFTKDPSSFCVTILRRAYGIHPPLIVAYYKDRPLKIKQAHITCLKLLQLYNAKACLESTRISLLQFFREKKCADRYLMRRPRSCQSDIQAGRSKQFGAPATEAVIKHQLELIADYVLEHSGEIWFMPIIDELLRYSYENKTKFDIVAALGMTFLADEELMFVAPKMDNTKANKFHDFGYWTDENGIKHFGVIPERNQRIAKIRQTAKTYDTDYYGYERLRISYRGLG